jgi:hypothetical protein
MSSNSPASGSQDLIALPVLASETAKLCGTLPPRGSYVRLRNAAYDGRLETVKIQGRVYVPRSALPFAAAELGLQVPSAKAA